MDTIHRLMDINNEAWRRHGYHCRPKNERDYTMLLYEIAENFFRKKLLNAITPADLDALTDHNYHTAREASEKAIEDLKEWGSLQEIPLF